ncbi:MAG: nitrilase [Gemmatimonadaceae bacterium]|nr:nitrilase [Gemmatimonadaceae bacterium]
MTYRVAVAQLKPAATTDAALEQINASCAEATTAGAQLVLFPEAYVGGYPRGSSFGAIVGSRTEAGRDAYHRYWSQAIEVPGAAVDRLGTIAAHHQLFLVVGVVERDGGTLYCTVLFFAPDGQYLGKHRKLMPTASERLIWGFGNGSTMPVFDTPLGKLGAVICWENYMPLLRAAHYAKGIQLYCAPTADSRDTWLPTMRHIAVEGRCFVLSANLFAERRDYPEADVVENGAPTDIVCRGGSCIVDPFGTVLAGPVFDREALLVADVDLAATIRGKFDFDASGHYARPDVFQLVVNEADTPAVRVVHDVPLA